MTKRALVTGATKGIGYAVAERLLSMGYDVMITYFGESDQALSVQKELTTKHNHKVEIWESDASDLSSIDKLTQQVKLIDWQFDVIVLNAGLTDRTQFPNIDPAKWQQVMTANVDYPVFLLQAIDERINPNASIIFTGSLMGILPHSVSLVYGVTKAAVHALVKNLVKFYAPRKIRVNGVAPGFVDTEWQKDKPIEIRQRIESKIALNRFCPPNQLADVYEMIAKNNYINGEIIIIDGGYSYQ